MAKYNDFQISFYKIHNGILRKNQKHLSLRKIKKQDNRLKREAKKYWRRSLAYQNYVLTMKSVKRKELKNGKN